jgi:glycosyltransferase involved in cell wall biosynthesis
VKGAVVPRVVRGAAGVLVTGTLARESVVARGADPARVRVFANTVDVERLSTRAADLRAGREERSGAVTVLSVARLAPEKGLDVLLHAAARAAVKVVLVGGGPLRGSLEHLARSLGVDARFAGVLPWESLVEEYVAADVFALLSRHEPWGVVVNEAAACGLPLVLSDRVGAAPDLLHDGENGILVPADDVEATAAALQRVGGDAELRARFGARSRELAAGWGYGPSVEAFVAAVVEAVSTLAA